MSTVTGYDEMTNGQTKAVISKMGGVQVALAFLRGEYELTKVAKTVQTALLTQVGAVSITATTEKFIAKEKFVVNTSADAEVKINFIGDNFSSWFLSGDGKIENPISEQRLRYHKLCKATVDGPIIQELGGEAKPETTLSEMFALMKKQGKGEDGVPLNNGYANIFYIRDATGVLRTVRVSWGVGGWRVGAGSVEDPRAWRAGIQVFARN